MITLFLLIRATYMYGVVLHAHPVRGESHSQRNTTREVATPLLIMSFCNSQSIFEKNPFSQHTKLYTES